MSARYTFTLTTDGNLRPPTQEIKPRELAELVRERRAAEKSAREPPSLHELWQAYDLQHDIEWGDRETARQLQAAEESDQKLARQLQAAKESDREIARQLQAEEERRYQEFTFQKRAVEARDQELAQLLQAEYDRKDVQEDNREWARFAPPAVV